MALILCLTKLCVNLALCFELLIIIMTKTPLKIHFQFPDNCKVSSAFGGETEPTTSQGLYSV